MHTPTGQVTICLTCGPDMVDTHLLHQLDREQGMGSNNYYIIFFCHNFFNKLSTSGFVCILTILEFKESDSE